MNPREFGLALEFEEIFVPDDSVGLIV